MSVTCTPKLAPPIPPEHVDWRYVVFLHPAFLTENSFLYLPALDTKAIEETELSSRPSEGSSFKYGVHHATALEACRIIADNQPGFLSETNDRTKRVNCGLDEVLFASQYYYFLEDATLDSKYPLVTRFSDWAFPTNNIPESWNAFTTPVPNTHAMLNIPASDMSARIHARDTRCKISGYRDEVQNAYIVPRAELDWFIANAMRVYNRNFLLPTHATEDIRNGILLRADIHSCFDRKSFAAVPKMGKPTLHFLQNTFNLGGLYHNTLLDLPPDMRAEFWYARFAWSLFPLQVGWDMLKRPVVLRVDGVREVKEERLPPEQPRSRSKRARSSSRGSDESPSKKLRGEADMEEVVEAVEDSGLSEHVSQPDEDAEYVEDLELQRKRFPAMSQEHCYSDDPVWNQICWYPGQRKVLRQMRRYMQDHPSITTVAEPDKADWVDPEDVD